MLPLRGRLSLLAFILIGLSGLVVGCVKPDLPIDSVSIGLNCIDDSPDCMAKRQAALDKIMADPSGSWIEQPSTAAGDASGVRLFAYKMKKKTLTCGQLQQGYSEALGAGARLRAANDPRLTPALISRGAIFGEEVARELKHEIRKRGCTA